MIHKRYRLNGTPDLRRWVFECDRCHCRRSIADIRDWLIPSHPQPWVRTYCPPCVERIAALLITIATRSA
ncbi:hypothetical protein ACIG5D_04015 [Microbispora rosea]|uniref:hypothetical protein n=1 Tax=Microbispora TaxID=2005 RepID=UPI0024A0164B|nr:hypothetical protein [Microbispora sp. NBRC 16548]GLX08577.1 hypothetical protein Misp03_55030 [Microbispora sp. NBRC 16548]